MENKRVIDLDNADNVRELGGTKFVIGIPYSGSDFDDDRMMYSPKQRAEICNKYLEDENLEGDSIVVRQGTPTILVKELVWHAYLVQRLGL